MCVCVCVCVCERERERFAHDGTNSCLKLITVLVKYFVCDFFSASLIVECFQEHTIMSFIYMVRIPYCPSKINCLSCMLKIVCLLKE